MNKRKLFMETKGSRIRGVINIVQSMGILAFVTFGSLIFGGDEDREAIAEDIVKFSMHRERMAGNDSPFFRLGVSSGPVEEIVSELILDRRGDGDFLNACAVIVSARGQHSSKELDRALFKYMESYDIEHLSISDFSESESLAIQSVISLMTKRGLLSNLKSMESWLLKSDSRSQGILLKYLIEKNTEESKGMIDELMDQPANIRVTDRYLGILGISSKHQ